MAEKDMHTHSHTATHNSDALLINVGSLSEGGKKKDSLQLKNAEIS